MKKLKAKIISGLIAGSSALPLLASAQAPTTINDVVDIVLVFINWIFAFFILLSVIFVLYAAFKYLTSRGDSGKVGEATQALIYAAIAIAVALLAASIQFIVGELILGGGPLRLNVPRPIL